MISSAIRSCVSRIQAEEECAAQHWEKILLKTRHELFSHPCIFRVQEAIFFNYIQSVWVTKVTDKLFTSELSTVLGQYRQPEGNY